MEVSLDYVGISCIAERYLVRRATLRAMARKGLLDVGFLRNSNGSPRQYLIRSDEAALWAWCARYMQTRRAPKKLRKIIDRAREAGDLGEAISSGVLEVGVDRLSLIRSMGHAGELCRMNIETMQLFLPECYIKVAHG